MGILSQQQIAFYHENGFLSLPSIMDEREVAWLRDIYDRLFEARAGRAEGNQFDLAGADEEGVEARLPQILGPSNYAPEMRDGEYLKSALVIAQDLIGAEASYGGDHAIFKPARIGAETPWHQDEAYWDPSFDYNSMSIWIPLQPATVENGCMWFVPGSHKLDVLPHHTINHDPRIHGLEVEGADVSSAVACPLPAGGATIHHNRTLHFTGPNRSDMPRRALILGFGVPAVPRADERRFPWNEQKQTPREERARAAAGDPQS